MTFVFRIITRLFVVAIGYFFAVLAAGAFIALAIYGWGLNNSSGEELIIQTGFAGFVALLSSFFIGTSAVTPSALAIVVAEAFSVRSMIINCLIGGLLAIGLLLTSGVYVETQGVPPQTDIIIAAAAGFVAGFIYWLIAGRNASGWR